MSTLGRLMKVTISQTKIKFLEVATSNMLSHLITSLITQVYQLVEGGWNKLKVGTSDIRVFIAAAT